MLFLKPPYHMIEGVALFGDHERDPEHEEERGPAVFHYAPGMPRISTVFDPAVNQEIPQIQLLKFRGEAGTGGFLNFAVDLAIDEARLDEVKRKLKAMFGLRDDPILSPMLFEDGLVKLMMLGAATPDPGAPPADDQAPQRFVVDMDHHSRPALYGKNNAIFSVELDQDGVQLVEASFETEITGIGIIYSLDFLALRPAFQVKVTADWDRVQTHFEESFSVGVLFSSIEIGEVVDKLVEDRVINIEVDSFLPEGEEDAGWIGHREEALNDFKDMVTRSFFEPSVDPLKPEESDWADEVQTASQVGLLLATGGWAGAASFSYKKFDMTRIDRKSINLTMNERVTVRRSIYPQAHLSGLFRLLRDADGAIDKSRFIREVTLDDDWFRRREVTAHALVSFDADQVEALNVSLDYGGRVETVRLTKETPKDTRRWNSIVDAGIMRRGVDYDYSVSFRGVDASERPALIQSPRRTTVRDAFEVAPQNEKLYFIDDIQIGTAGFPWDRYPSVEVQLRYADEANGIDLDDSFQLTQAAPEVTWKRFRMNEALDGYQIRRVFHAADNRDRVIEWTDLDQERFTIGNPLPRSRTVQVVPAVAWQLVSMVFVEMSYEDRANGVFQSQTLFFMNTDQDRGPKTFAVDLVDETRRFVRYSAKILLIDNRQISIPPSDTQESVIFIRPDMVGHRVIEVLSPQEDFAAKGVARFDAELAYDDPGNGLSFADKFSFDAPGQSRVFEFDYADSARSAYRLITTEILRNGMSRRREPGLTVENPLRLRLS
jgi:hypothetical protein